MYTRRYIGIHPVVLWLASRFHITEAEILFYFPNFFIYRFLLGYKLTFYVANSVVVRPTYLRVIEGRNTTKLAVYCLLKLNFVM